MKKNHNRNPFLTHERFYIIENFSLKHIKAKRNNLKFIKFKLTWVYDGWPSIRVNTFLSELSFYLSVHKAGQASST